VAGFLVVFFKQSKKYQQRDIFIKKTNDVIKAIFGTNLSMLYTFEE
jgi:hypothetical protein